MALIKFGGIPLDVAEKFFNTKTNSSVFNISIHKKIYTYKGFEIVYNPLIFAYQLEDDNKTENAKKIIREIYDRFLKENPEEFFKAMDNNSERKFPFFTNYLSINKEEITKQKNAYTINSKIDGNKSKIESSLKFINNFLRSTSYESFDTFNRGIPLTKERKNLLREYLIDLISIFGAKIIKTAQGSTTKIFIMENPFTKKGKEYTIQYHNMPTHLRKKYHDTDSYLTFEIVSKALKTGEGKEYNSKLYEELMTEEEEKEFELEKVEEVLNMQQRRKRAMTMKRFSSKIALARKRNSHRMADSGHLMKRARHAAINIMRKRFAGALGKNYAVLSVGQKMEVDKKVQAKKNLIDRIARKLLPKIKAKEVRRMSGANKEPK